MIWSGPGFSLFFKTATVKFPILFFLFRELTIGLLCTVSAGGMSPWINTELRPLRAGSPGRSVSKVIFHFLRERKGSKSAGEGERATVPEDSGHFKFYFHWK